MEAERETKLARSALCELRAASSVLGAMRFLRSAQLSSAQVGMCEQCVKLLRSWRLAELVMVGDELMDWITRVRVEFEVRGKGGCCSSCAIHEVEAMHQPVKH